MTYANGAIPLSAMVKLATPHYLPPGTAQGWLALAHDLMVYTGFQPILRPFWDAYRPLWAQAQGVAIYGVQGFPTAAPLGTSKHGDGKAIDVDNWMTIGMPTFTEFCNRHHFSTERIEEEPHHVEYDLDPWGIHPVAPTHFRPTLALGSTGDAVKPLQGTLGVAVNGSFNSATDAAVRAFQTRTGIRVDGIVGPHTWVALGM